MMKSCNVLGLAIGVGCCVPALAQAQQQPNILLIHVDQHRYDCQQMVSSHVKTPNLKRLSEQGMQFTNAFTPIPTSCPARECLLSGMWPEQHHGLWNWDITLPAPEFNAPTWTELLSKAGYKSGYIGKWHVHPTKTPLDYGFDDYVPEWGPYENWRKKQGLPDVCKMNDGPFFGGYDPVDKESSKTHYMANKAIAMIREYAKGGAPWHVRLDLAEPHLPCFPAKEFYDMYDEKELKEWGNFGETFENKPYIQRQQLYNWGIEKFTWADWSKYLRRYLATITQVDDAVGKVLDALQKLGLDKNTIIIYTADHGDAAGSHRMLDKHYVMYDEEVHIPLIVRWDKVVKQGSTCDKFVIQELDLASTFCEVAKLDFKTQGASLLPLLRQEPCEWRTYAFSNYNGQQFGLYVQRMIRDNKMKYVWNMTDIDELYDLEHDPDELHNLIGDATYKSELQRLRHALYENLKQRRDPLVRQDAVRMQLIEGRKL